jgi:hypothetical protein
VCFFPSSSRQISYSSHGTSIFREYVYSLSDIHIFLFNSVKFRWSVLRFYLVLIHSYSIWLWFTQRLCVFLPPSVPWPEPHHVGFYSESTYFFRFSPLYCLGISHLFPCSLCVYHPSKYQSLNLSTISLCSSEYVLFLYEVAFGPLIHWFFFLFQEVRKLFEFPVLAFAHAYI